MELTDKEKISAIRLRNEYLTGEIYRLYRNEFFFFLKNRLWKDQEVILDIYQDAFMVLCNKIYEDKLNADNLTSSLKTYLFGVGIKIAYNVNRRGSHFQEQDLKSIQDIPDDESGLGEENEKIIQTAVNEMGEPCYTILVKQYWEGKSGEASLSVLKQSIREYGKPEIINSDQGSQFTCEQWVAYLKEKEILISMDGKGRAIDNIFIERFWRTSKYDYVYLHPAIDGLELYQGIKQYIHYYIHELHHQGIDRRVPAELYQSAA
jgi:DNA-directed RNA polymerase specialized sigma24 family protein